MASVPPIAALATWPAAECNIEVDVAETRPLAFTSSAGVIHAIRFDVAADAVARMSADLLNVVAVMPATIAAARIAAWEEISMWPCEVKIPRGRGDADSENRNSESSEGIKAALPRLADEDARLIRLDDATGEGMGWTIRRLIRLLR